MVTKAKVALKRLGHALHPDGFWLWFAMAAMPWVLCGCPPQSKTEPPRPHFTTERAESTNGIGLVVKFHDLNWSDQYSGRGIKVNNIQELENLRKEINFVLLELEDTEKRMRIHEQEAQISEPLQ